MDDEKDEVTFREAAGAGAKIVGYLVLVIVLILVVTTVLGALVAPLVP
jgi:hypothetical protein